VPNGYGRRGCRDIPAPYPPEADLRQNGDGPGGAEARR